MKRKFQMINYFLIYREKSLLHVIMGQSPYYEHFSTFIRAFVSAVSICYGVNVLYNEEPDIH